MWLTGRNDPSVDEAIPGNAARVAATSLVAGHQGAVMRVLARVSLVLGIMAAAGPAMANTTITDATNNYRAGIGPNGELYDDRTDVGLRNPDGADHIQPGTPRDSWGITGSTGSAFADYMQTGNFGIITTTLTPDTHSATAVTTTNAGLTVRQVYSFLAPNILSIEEFVTNSNTVEVTGIIFRRNVDFDIQPTLYTENTVGPYGTNLAVVGNSFDGFQNPDPTNPFENPCNPCNIIEDTGAGIDLGVGTLGAGESAAFTFYYGINQPGQSLDQLIAQAQGLGVSYLLGVQSTENDEHPGLGAGSGFLGVGNLRLGVVGSVPEPSTWMTMILGFGLAGAALRRRRRIQPVDSAAAM